MPVMVNVALKNPTADNACQHSLQRECVDSINRRIRLLRSKDRGMIDEFIHRYSLGDHRSSWADLSRVKISELDPDEQRRLTDFARGVMKTLVSNIYALSKSLKSEGFKFRDEENAIIPSSPKTLELLDLAEAEIGKVPLILRCFYEVFDDVCFVQDFKQYHDQQSRFFHFGVCSTLVVHSPKHAMDRWEYTNSYWQRKNASMDLTVEEPYQVERFFETGLDYSGSEPDGIRVRYCPNSVLLKVKRKKPPACGFYSVRMDFSGDTSPTEG